MILYLNNLILFPILEDYISYFDKNRVYKFQNRFYFNMS